MITLFVIIVTVAKKEISFLHWIVDLLPEEIQEKAFFGGRSFYSNEKIVLAVFENPGERRYKDFVADFDIWCGCLFPVDFEKQSMVQKKFPDLVVHPVLRKWLYLPSSHEDFESIAGKIIKQISRGSDLFGTIPNQKKSSTPKLMPKAIQIEKIKAADMKRPRMFADERPEDIFKKAQTIADLKNLGPATFQQFQKAGIKSVQQFIKMGWKKAMIKLVKSNPKHRHTLYAYALIGALKNQDWHKLSEADKLDASQFVKSLKK